MVKVAGKQTSRRWPYWWPLLVVVVLLAIGGWFLWHKPAHKATATSQTSAKVDLSPATKADNSANNARKGSTNAGSTLDSGSSAASQPASFTAQIVSANVNNGNLHVGTQVSGTTTGSCSLTASKEGQTSLQLGSSSVHQDVNTYDCGVFNIATSKFPTGGSWAITLTVTSNGASNSNSVTVNI